MTRKSPIHHKVRGHTRKGKRVEPFERGKGQSPQKSREAVVVSQKQKDAQPKVIKTRHHLTRLSDGQKQIDMIIDFDTGIEALVKKTLTARLKSGWILSEDYDKNRDTIGLWDNKKEFISDTQREIREYEENVASMRDQIVYVESGKMDVLRVKLPQYREVLGRDLKSLSTKKQRLDKAKIEFSPLNNTIKSLKDNFKSYITHWRKSNGDKI